MYKKRRKKKADKGKIQSTSDEFTIPELSLKDFADATEPKPRSRKTVQAFTKSNPINYESPEVESDSPWYEREDFNIEKPLGNTEEIQTDLENKLSSKMKRKKKVKNINSNSFSGDYVFPDDLWHLLSMHIRPEDVLRFSLICKGACNAVLSTGFWMRLYSIYIQDQDKLPVSLRRDRIDCGPGLRSRVVRALYKTYDPFKYRLVMSSFQGSSCLDSLMYWTCSSTWFHPTTTKKDTKIWMLYFKFSQRENTRLPASRFTKEWIDTADAVRDNPEQVSPVLALSCLNFISFRPVLGMILSQGLVGISQNMKNSRVKLMFHNQRERDKKYRPESGYEVVLDPVQQVNVLYWWDPKYPHQDIQ